MTQHLRLAEFGKAGEVLAAKFGAEEFSAAPIAGIARRQVGAAAAFGREFENQRHA